MEKKLSKKEKLDLIRLAMDEAQFKVFIYITMGIPVMIALLTLFFYFQDDVLLSIALFVCFIIIGIAYYIYATRSLKNYHKALERYVKVLKNIKN